jgi:putative membrane protein
VTGQATTAALGSALHIACIGLGVTTLAFRLRALRGPFDRPGFDRLFFWDNLAGLAAMALIGSGLWRLLAGLEKPTDYYLASHGFWLKMGIYGGAFACEMLPMTTFLRWRSQLKKGATPDTARAPRLHRLLAVQLALTFCMIPAAAMMARGFGYRRAQASSPACAVEQLAMVRCVSCHGPGNQQAGLDLVSDPQAALVDQPSSAWPAVKRVVPSDPAASLLIRKLRGTQGSMGAQMPLGSLLPDEEIVQFESWIAAGAPRCD